MQSIKSKMLKYRYFIGTLFGICLAYILNNKIVTGGGYTYLFCVLCIFSVILVCDISHLNKDHMVLIIVCGGMLVFSGALSYGFYYHDDYWNYPGYPYFQRIDWGLGRPFQCLIANLFGTITPSISFYARWFTLFWGVLLTIFLFQWVNIKTGRTFYALSVAVILGYNSAMADCVSYLAISSYIYGIVLMTISLYLFEQAYIDYKDNWKKAAMMGILSMVMCFTALMAYQLTYTMVFLLYAMKIMYEKDVKSSINQAFIHLGEVFLCLLTYYAIMSYIGIGERGGHISTIGEVQDKIIWFFNVVIPSVTDRIIGMFFGKSVFINIDFSSAMAWRQGFEIFKIISRVSVWCLVIWGILIISKAKKKAWLNFILICLIPLSYSPFLLLKESGYMTYYAFPMLLLLLFYMIVGFESIIIKCIKSAKARKILVLLCTVLVCFQTYYYEDKGYVEQNKKAFDYIKESIQAELAHTKLSHIHLFGSPRAGEDVYYSVKAAELALRELGLENDEIEISASSYYYVPRIEEDIFMSAVESLNDIDRKRFEEYYIYDMGNYYIDYSKIVLIEDLEFIRNCSLEIGLIPQSGETLLIDLTWIKGTWD